MGKRMISVLLIVGICLSVTACSPVENLFDIMDRITDNDNPLSGKSTTGSLSKLRSKSWKFFMLENLPKPVRLIVIAVVAFCGAAMIKLALVHFFGL